MDTRKVFVTWDYENTSIRREWVANTTRFGVKRALRMLNFEGEVDIQCVVGIIVQDRFHDYVLTGLAEANIPVVTASKDPEIPKQAANENIGAIIRDWLDEMPRPETAILVIISLDISMMEGLQLAKGRGCTIVLFSDEACATPLLLKEPDHCYSWQSVMEYHPKLESLPKKQNDLKMKQL